MHSNIKQPQNREAIVVGEGSDMQFNPTVWEKWNSDACDADPWKYGRVSNKYRDNYDNIKWENE